MTPSNGISTTPPVLSGGLPAASAARTGACDGGTGGNASLKDGAAGKPACLPNGCTKPGGAAACTGMPKGTIGGIPTCGAHPIGGIWNMPKGGAGCGTSRQDQTRVGWKIISAIQILRGSFSGVSKPIFYKKSIVGKLLTRSINHPFVLFPSQKSSFFFHAQIFFFGRLNFQEKSQMRCILNRCSPRCFPILMKV